MNVGGINAGVEVHDPAVYVKNDKYYLFGTHMTLAESDDLRYFKLLAGGENKENPLFENLFTDNMEAFSYCGSFNDTGEWAVWAPDVVYLESLKKYVMYFCLSGSYVKSNICMATADNLTGPYRFERRLIYSGFNEATIDQTNFEEITGSRDISKYIKKNGNYNNLNWPNAIDPNVFKDKDGELWLVYGSWSGGIFLLKIDKNTGLLVHPKEDAKNRIDRYFGKKLIGGGHKSIEGPCIIYDDELDYYYLFVSYGRLKREGGYQIRVFRSKKPDGPYLDMLGKTFTRVSHHEPYGLKLIGNYILPSNDIAYKSPGHNSLFKDEDGNIYCVYHQRFDNGTEHFEPRVHQVFRTGSNWLAISPFATSGEMHIQKSYLEAEVSGTYYMLEHGLDISNHVNEAKKVRFEMDHNIYLIDDNETKTDIGVYKLSDHGLISIIVNDTKYDGVIIQQIDEAKNPTMCITAVGENQSFWAVKYI
ncbi:MAG: glycoside hydrolase family 43 protein [Lachnospiraceae bacterium]|nr:glycoside hydrolase family 43 protein [Lachnospiraceae bacterium]